MRVHFIIQACRNEINKIFSTMVVQYRHTQLRQVVMLLKCSVWYTGSLQLGILNGSCQFIIILRCGRRCLDLVFLGSEHLRPVQ